MYLLLFLLCIGFGWYTKKLGFTSMWIALFNAVISIYISIMLMPTIVGYAPSLSSVYAKVMCGFGLSLFLFVITQYAVVIYFENALDVTLPELFSKIGAGMSGFLLAFIVSNFFLFNIFSMLAVSNPDSKWVNSVIAKQSRMKTTSVCNFIHRLGAQPDDELPAEAVKWYATKPAKDKKKQENKEDTEADDNDVVELL